MAANIVEFESAHGPVRVEIEDPSRPGPVAVGRGDTVAESAAESFESALAGVRPVAEGILGQLTTLAERPETVEVVFGIKLSGKLGAILASTTAEAHCTVKLVWNAPRAGKP